MHIGIIGAGIFGLAAALELRTRGHEVSIFEQGTIPNERASSTDLCKVIRRTSYEGSYLELVDRRFVNVYDASPKTKVEVADLGPLAPIDPYAESSLGLGTHLYELPDNFDLQRIEVRISFEDGRIGELPLLARNK